MKKTYKFSQELINQLTDIVRSHTSRIESSERWSEDRDETYEWRNITDALAHLAWCPFRRKFLEGKPIKVTFESKLWKQIRKILITEYKKKIHPLYTTIYPNQIKEFKKKESNSLYIIDIQNKITKEHERWTRNRKLIKQILEVIK